MARERRQTSQTIAWFRDLFVRNLLDLDPPYQRRSVWNQAYKDYFIETVLLQYPAPAVFLHEDISPSGIARYSVVDGKQRLSALFEFTDNIFPISEKCPINWMRGLYFEQLPEEARREFWTYQFSVEYLTTTDETTLNSIFDRINRNVAKLTPQELRHARYSGEFVTTAEELTEVMQSMLPADFPRYAPASKRQMKDVEGVTQLLLLIENGVESYSQAELDKAYSSRDVDWENKQATESEFREVVAYLSDISVDILNSHNRRLRNQTDFYSLFGAVLELKRDNDLPSIDVLESRLNEFLEEVVDDKKRAENTRAKDYFEAARSASNDVGPRKLRIATMRAVIAGK